MTGARQLFLEDVRRCWPRMVIFLATLLLGAISYASPRHMFDLPPTLILAEVLRPLACWILVAQVVRDPIMFPYNARLFGPVNSWKRLLGSKLIFLVAIINLPVFVYHLAILVSYGISPLHWAPALLWRQLFLTVYFILPAAALAAVTRNDWQMLGAAAGIWVVWVFVFVAFPSRPWDAGGMEWIRWSVGVPVIVAGTTACLLMQYSRRRRLRAWSVLGATAALALLLFRFHPWALYFALQDWSSHERISPSAVLVSFDNSRAGAAPPKFPGRGPVEVVIPVRVSPVPPGVELEEYRSSVAIEGRSGTWRSGWFDAWVFDNLSGAKPWLAIGVDKQFYEINRDIPVRLTVDATFTLRRRMRPSIRWQNGVANIDGFGQCRVAHFGDRSDTYTCYSPVFQPMVSSDAVYLCFPGIPTTPSFDPLYASNTTDIEVYSPKTAYIEAPVAHIRRTFEVNGLRMSTYRVELPHQAAGPEQVAY